MSKAEDNSMIVEEEGDFDTLWREMEAAKAACKAAGVPDNFAVHIEDGERLKLWTDYAELEKTHDADEIEEAQEAFADEYAEEHGCGSLFYDAEESDDVAMGLRAELRDVSDADIYRLFLSCRDNPPSNDDEAAIMRLFNVSCRQFQLIKKAATRPKRRDGKRTIVMMK